MRKISLLTAVILFVSVSAILTGCPRNTYSPSSPYGPANTSTATPTATGPTSTPTSTPTVTGTATPTNSPTITYTPTLTPTSTNSPTVTLTFTATNTATVTSTATITSTPTVTPTPQTITVSVASNGSGSNDPSGFYYTVGGVTNNANYTINLTANVGDTVILPASNTHPLYLYEGSTCIYSGQENASTQSYTFTSSGTYYFHCGNHAANCTMSSCSSTGCTGMAGMITVN